MFYKLKISSKNQVTLPVALLKDVGLGSTEAESHLILAKNFAGRYELVDPKEILDQARGFLGSDNIPNLTDVQLEQQIAQARDSHLKQKYLA